MVALLGGVLAETLEGAEGGARVGDGAAGAMRWHYEFSSASESTATTPNPALRKRTYTRVRDGRAPSEASRSKKSNAPTGINAAARRQPRLSVTLWCSNPALGHATAAGTLGFGNDFIAAALGR